MKKKLFVLLVICSLAVNFRGFGCHWPSDTSQSNYVVIGAFAIEENAIQFAELAKKGSFNAEFEINPNRNLFYVYVLHTPDLQTAYGEARKIRKATPFSDTWVYTGILGRNPAQASGSDMHPVTEKKLESVTPDDGPVEERVSVTSEALSSTPAETVPANESPVQVVQADEAVEGGKKFLFKIVALTDQKEVQGDVDVIDLDKTKKVASYQGNQNIVIGPVNKSGKLSLACEVFGYKKITKELNFNQPGESEGASMNGEQTVIPFELTRLKKGDIAIMYNVYFFRDAAIMKPESKYEVLSLTEMMKENPKYRIKIHGHTNGSAAGKVISLGESKNYFSLTDTKEGFGSAKKLSEERAHTIREFLIAEGIDGKRMLIKAWGGKRPIHDKMSPHAQSNVRVEIEILEDK